MLLSDKACVVVGLLLNHDCHHKTNKLSHSSLAVFPQLNISTDPNNYCNVVICSYPEIIHTHLHRGFLERAPLSYPSLNSCVTSYFPSKFWPLRTQSLEFLTYVFLTHSVVLF